MDRQDKEGLWMILERNGIRGTEREIERYREAQKVSDDAETNFAAFIEEEA